jgi:uncharacterized membrane protein
MPSGDSSLPNARELKEYEAAVPGAAARLLRMADEEQRHIHELDDQQLGRARRGQVFALTISLAFLGVSGFLISGGHDVAGTVIGSVDLVALATVFIVGQRSQIAIRQANVAEDDRFVNDLLIASRRRRAEQTELSGAKTTSQQDTSSASANAPVTDSSETSSTADRTESDLQSPPEEVDNARPQSTEDDAETMSTAEQAPVTLTEEDEEIWKRINPRSGPS